MFITCPFSLSVTMLASTSDRHLFVVKGFYLPQRYTKENTKVNKGVF